LARSSAGGLPALGLGFVTACALLRPAIGNLESDFGLYLAAALGLMVFAMTRVSVWKRANPWTPPS
jgi:hypothetical protein